MEALLQSSNPLDQLESIRTLHYNSQDEFEKDEQLVDVLILDHFVYIHQISLKVLLDLFSIEILLKPMLDLEYKMSVHSLQDVSLENLSTFTLGQHIIF